MRKKSREKNKDAEMIGDSIKDDEDEINIYLKKLKMNEK
jgi:hypothetical protein